MTTSQFMEQARYINAMEQELARSVSEISSIQSARVHLALPKQSVFVRDRRPAKASVVVTPFSGRGINLAQVQAIIHLISSSVPNLLPKDVAVVDNFGIETNLYSQATRTVENVNNKPSGRIVIRRVGQ